MTIVDAKLKHLEFIQAAIGRMSANSSLYKGWAITVAAALAGFAAVNDKSPLLVIAAATTAMFWGLDGYYLWLERGFIKLHSDVAATPEGAVDFSMKIDKRNAFGRWLLMLVRPHLLLFYGTIFVAELLAIYVVRAK